MRRTRAATLAAAAALGAVTLGRAVIAGTALRRAEPTKAAPASTQDTTVLIAVRSGDPLLPRVLAESIDTLSPATVKLLVDDEDQQACEIAAQLTGGHGRDHVEMVTCPPPPPAVNPKVFKLALVAGQCSGPIVVLDDDTALPPGALSRLVSALDSADLVTGVPVYREQGSFWSRLLAAFVNGSSLVTYLPMAAVAPAVSINGMVYATTTKALSNIGGFGAIEDATCDDYALALAYRARGLRIRQVAQPAIVTTTVDGPGEYARIMRRWMSFAGQVVRHDASPALAGIVVIPSILPAVALALSIASRDRGALAAAGLAVAGSAVIHRELRRRAGIPATGMAGIILEPVAAVLNPFFALWAACGSGEVTWRGRRMRVGVGIQ